MTPTLLSASKANQLIDAINSLQNIKIEYGPNFKAKYGSNGVILTIPYPQITGGIGGEEEFEMFVCVNGEAVKKTFIVA